MVTRYIKCMHGVTPQATPLPRIFSALVCLLMTILLSSPRTINPPQIHTVLPASILAHGATTWLRIPNKRPDRGATTWQCINRFVLDCCSPLNDTSYPTGNPVVPSCRSFFHEGSSA